MELSLANIGHVLLGINLTIFLIGLKIFKKEKAYTIFTVYLLITAVISAIMSYLAHYRENNLFLSHYYFISQFVVLSMFYRELLNKRQKRFTTVLLGTVLIILVALFALEKMNYYDLEPFNPIEVFICSFPIIMYAIIHLYNSLNSHSLNYTFINSAILIYLSVSTLVFILASFFNSGLYSDLSPLLMLWKFNRIFFLLFHSLIFIEWYKKFKQSQVK